ncbi:MAG TPA: helix-turn-helix domain-containing protein [Candidatus Nanoarchaeia archaeon]|nr:helix-turn-helix domain-containing protein [Candidatus Nanoarchaeia archaeon]
MIPSENELLEFISKKELVNLSMIAKFFNIKNATASDLVKDLVSKKLVEVKQIGGSKIVVLKKRLLNAKSPG